MILNLARFVAGFKTLRMILIGHVTVEKQQQGGQGQTVTTPWGPTTQRVHQSISFILMKKTVIPKSRIISDHMINKMFEHSLID